MEIQNLAQLLEKLGTINYKYSLLKEKDRFNVFEILRKKHDEVHLHSRFIAELLNPKGTHEQGKVFLELFVEMLQNNINNSETFKRSFGFKELEKAKAIVEHFTGPISKDKTVGGNIDIYISGIGDSSIIIENKIYAEDQENQLLRYHNYDKKGLIVYLTLYGKEPSSYSTGGNAPDFEVLLLSYKEDIEGWLEKCIEKSAKKPELREAIVQYQKLIHKLTGNTTSMGEFEEIYDLLSKNDNMKNAKIIGDNWDKIKIQTELFFWQELEIEIKAKSNYIIKDQSRYSKTEISNNVLNKRGSKPYYGIVFKVGEYKATDILFKIERGSHKTCYGFWSNNYRNELNSYISNECDKQDNHASIGTKYLIPKLNFAEFSSEDTLKMSNEAYRKDQITKYWEEMLKFIVICEVAFVENLGDNYKSILK
jgi:hypothetical protein